MLIEFRVENHRSIRDEQALTMEAGTAGGEEDPRPRDVGASKRLLPVAAIYGANASGKSNILAALGFMRDCVLDSQRAWPPEAGVPRDAFAWGPKRAEPSMFEVVVVLGGVRFQYGFVTDDERFVEEWLYAWPLGRKQRWFTRDGDSFQFGDALRGENKIIQQLTRSNALFLSAAAQHRHEQLAPLWRWMWTVMEIGVPSSAGYRQRWSMARGAGLGGLPRFPGEIEPLLQLLQTADMTIADVRFAEGAGDSRAGYSGVQVRHQGRSEDAWLPLEEESHGTRTLFRMGPTVLSVLGHGGLVLVDELEASLHPLLALHIVRLFNSPKTNPKNAQLVFTTHDSHLLGTLLGDPPLRRDQVWLTEKDGEGATALYPLTDYKPRKGENLERGYLQGRYGAIPFLGDLPPLKLEET